MPFQTSRNKKNRRAGVFLISTIQKKTSGVYQKKDGCLGTMDKKLECTCDHTTTGQILVGAVKAEVVAKQDEPTKVVFFVIHAFKHADFL
jgi:hypothetical protein